MSEDRKKPGWAFWTTVALCVPVLYVASFGPACWWWQNSKQISRLYRPLLLIASGSEHARSWLERYARIKNADYVSRWPMISGGQIKWIRTRISNAQIFYGARTGRFTEIPDTILQP